ncbi:MAG: TPR end-of-group domain-containing protein [Gammaproteobacteria bacterium]
MTDASSKLRRAMDELKRRKVFQVGAVYLIVGWLLIQIADSAFAPLNLPAWAQTLVIVLVAFGFPVAVILAWALEVTPAGIKRTPSDAPDAQARLHTRSIAVLPFVNISGDPDNEYFSDGLSEELLNLLARIPELRVCSRTSSFAFKGKSPDMKAVRDALNVGTVLEGSVRRSGSRIRIAAQLIDANSDSHLWSRTYDRELNDIFEVQDQIAASIVDALQLTLSSETRHKLEMPSTHNFKAYDYYLRGREFYHRSDKGHLNTAREMYEKAIDIDPNYAVAWAGLAICCADYYRYHGNRPGFLERATEASRKAVELNPALAEVWTARGLALWCSNRLDEAEQAFKDAIRINPSLFEPHHFYARMIIMEGLDRDAEAQLRRAAEVRPEDFQSRFHLAALLSNAEGRADEAAATLREALAVADAHLAIVPDDVRAIYLGALGRVHTGQSDAAIERIERALALQPDQPGVLYNAACVYSLLGNTERALDLLEKAVEAGMAYKSWIERDADFENLRPHPRFRNLLASM